MSKSLLKATGYTAIGFAFVYLFIFVIIHIVIPYNYLADDIYDYIILIGLAVLALISTFGGFIFLHYKDLTIEELKTKKGIILGWSLVFFITAGICGILGLIVYALLSNDIRTNTNIRYIDEIRELEKLAKKGLITEEEFKHRKKKILDI